MDKLCFNWGNLIMQLLTAGLHESPVYKHSSYIYIYIYTHIEGKTYVFCKTCHTVKQKCKVSWKHAVYLKQLPSFHHNGLLACTFEVFLILQAYLGVDEHLHLLNCYTSRCEIKRISITTTYGTIAKMIQTVAM